MLRICDPGPAGPHPGVNKGYGCYYGVVHVHAHCTALTQRLPSVPPLLPHVLAVDSDHAAVICTCRTCSCDTAPQSICRGRRTASACATHAHMPPCCTDMPAAVTAEPRAPRKLIGGRWAHERGLTDMVIISSTPMPLSPEMSAPLAAQRVDGSSSQIDICTAVDRGRAGIQSPSRGVAAPPRERCTQPPSQ